MGRAMLIICAGTLISLGIISMSTSQRGQTMTANAAGYANQMTAKNAAHSAIQSAMQEINGKNHRTHSGDWAADHDSTNPWTTSINNAQISLYVEYLNEDWDTNEYFESDSLRMVSKATYANKYEAEVTSVYEVGPISSLVPDFEGALSIATNNFNFNGGGSSSISGNSSSECEEDEDQTRPGVTVSSDDFVEDIENEKVDIEGNPPVGKNEDISYEPTDELIERLSNTEDVKNLSGNTNETLGTAEDPGVFFVEDNLKLTGKQNEGYGILVIRSDGEMEYEGDDGSSLDVAGNFEWNGLIIFENAYNFKGRGTPTINGSILVGHTTEDMDDDDDFDGSPIDIDLSGNIHLQYDCAAENYAKMAAANAVEQNRYERVVTFE